MPGTGVFFVVLYALSAHFAVPCFHFSWVKTMSCFFFRPVLFLLRRFSEAGGHFRRRIFGFSGSSAAPTRDGGTYIHGAFFQVFTSKYSCRYSRNSSRSRIVVTAAVTPCLVLLLRKRCETLRLCFSGRMQCAKACVSCDKTGVVLGIYSKVSNVNMSACIHPPPPTHHQPTQYQNHPHQPTHPPFNPQPQPIYSPCLLPFKNILDGVSRWP